MTLLSRSSAMLNEIDPKQAQSKSRLCEETNPANTPKREAQLAATHYPATASAVETGVAAVGAGGSPKGRQRLSAMQAADDGDTVTASRNLITRAAPH